MILVFASAFNEAAAAFVAELGRQRPAALVTCSTLASGQLCLYHPGFARSTLTAGGRCLSVAEVRGALNLLPAILPEEIFFYGAEEREYQANELHALVTFFLSSLPCRVVNRPTASSLSGPYPNPLGWHSLAGEASIPRVPIDVRSDAFENPFGAAPPTTIELECLAGNLLSPSRTHADEYTLELARRAEVEYLRARFQVDATTGAPRFCCAHTLPDVGAPVTRAALVHFFSEGSP